MKRYVKIIVSYDTNEGRPEDDTYESIRRDLESEISCCWHFFGIESIEIMGEKGDTQ